MTTNTAAPRGIRNNNPGNIRKNDSFEWLGEIGDDGAFVIFAEPEHGVRALTKLLTNYRKLYGINTIAGILDRYAPSSENDTNSYIAHAVRELGVSEFTPLEKGDYLKLVNVIIQHENGQNPYDVAVINAGFEAGYA